jgi:hypothetical protein
VSVKCIDAVLALRLSPLDKLTLLVLADCCDPSGGNAYPSVPYLMAITGLRRRKIQSILSRHRSQPEHEGDDRPRRTRLLIVQQAASAARRQANVYSFNVELLLRLAAKGEARLSAARQGHRSARGAQYAPLKNLRGAQNDMKGRTVVRPQPSLNRQEEEDAPAIVENFDRAITEIFGNGKRRTTPHPGDVSTAARWLRAGASPALIGDVVRARLRWMHDHERRPPRALAAFTANIDDALAAPFKADGARSPADGPEAIMQAEIKRLDAAGLLPRSDSADREPREKALAALWWDVEAWWRAAHPGEAAE